VTDNQKENKLKHKNDKQRHPIRCFFIHKTVIKCVYFETHSVQLSIIIKIFLLSQHRLEILK